MTTTVAPPAPQTVVTGIMDGDGHSRERDEDLYPYFGVKYPLERLRNYPRGGRRRSAHRRSGRRRSAPASGSPRTKRGSARPASRPRARPQRTPGVTASVPRRPPVWSN